MTQHKETASGGPSVLRDLNNRRFLNLLRNQGPMTRSELAEEMNVSNVTVSKKVHALLQGGFIREVGTTGEGIGRRAALFDLEPTLGTVASADVSGGVTRVHIADLRGKVLAEDTFDTPGDEAAFVAEIAASLHRTCSQSGNEVAQVLSFVIAVPATVEPGMVLKYPGVPKYFEGETLATRLREALPGQEIGLINDVNAATLAERDRGAAADWRTYAFVGLRKSGMGMGLLIDGRLYEGPHGRAGEIGLLRLDRHPHALDEAFSAADGEAIDELATLLATAFALLDLEGVVFHTEIRPEFPWIDELNARLTKLVPYPVQIKLSRLQEMAPITGAVTVALGTAWQQIEGAAAPALNSESRSRSGGFR